MEYKYTNTQALLRRKESAIKRTNHLNSDGKFCGHEWTGLMVSYPEVSLQPLSILPMGLFLCVREHIKSCVLAGVAGRTRKKLDSTHFKEWMRVLAIDRTLVGMSWPDRGTSNLFILLNYNKKPLFIYL